MVYVRKAIKKDIDNIITFLSSRGYSLEEIYTDKDYFVYYENDELLGCGKAYTKEKYCIIDDVHVDADHRRKKIGTALVKTILNYYERGGSETALSFNGCSEFWNSLKFNKISWDNISDLLKKELENKNIEEIYIVSLKDYFESCC